jgi:hypothetical protein
MRELERIDLAPPRLGVRRDHEGDSGKNDSDRNAPHHATRPPGYPFQRMMRPPGGIKPTLVHIRAFTVAPSSLPDSTHRVELA